MGRKVTMFSGLCIVTFMFLSTCAWADSISINNNATWTNNPDVVVDYVALGETDYRISNYYSMTSYNPWYSLAGWFGTIAWRLDDHLEGQKWVYAEFRSGPMDSSPTTCSDSIWLDTTPPLTSTSSVVPTGWVKSADIYFSARDGGSGVDYTEYRIDDGGWTKLFYSCQVIAPLGTKVTRTVSYRSVDLAGNVEGTKSVQVNIDNTVPDTSAPLTTVSGSDSAWHAAPVLLTFSATDPGLFASGVAYTEYRVDGYAWLRANTMTVNAPAGGANDGVHKVEYRSVDNARNTETTKSAIVRVDTVGPRGKAQNVVVKRGKTCKLWFDVDDSISPKVTMALYVKTRGGSTKARWSWGYLKTWLRDDWWWYQKYTCRLKKGTYRIEVYSHDLAGNHQSRIGRAKLVVK